MEIFNYPVHIIVIYGQENEKLHDFFPFSHHFYLSDRVFIERTKFYSRLYRAQELL